MKVVIIGSGNVATVLGRKILSAGHEIIQVVGRNAESAALLASFLKTTYTSNLLEISLLGEIYIIAVSDFAISSVAGQLKLNEKLVVHTAAAVSKEVLHMCSSNFGVLYPLQSLKKEVSPIPSIPILVDANNEQTKETLIKFAASWADNVTIADDEERLKLHVAAVFVNNFTNHLFAVATQFCNDNYLDNRLLEPIIKETIATVGAYPASIVQTGPARRKDLETIAKHQHLLADNPKVLKLYNVLTNSILDFYAGK